MNWQKQLSDLGFRVSAPRKRVMAVLESAQQPLTPLELHQTLLRDHKAIGLASVYRTLGLLSALGIVEVVYRSKGEMGYMAAAQGHHHHILCQECQRAVEFSGLEDLSELIDHVENQTHYQVRDHLLQLYGLCPACQSKHADEKE